MSVLRERGRNIPINMSLQDPNYTDLGPEAALPWIQGIAEEDRIQLISREGWEVGWLQIDPLPEITKFVLDAVNSHDRLKAALQAAEARPAVTPHAVVETSGRNKLKVTVHASREKAVDYATAEAKRITGCREEEIRESLNTHESHEIADYRVRITQTQTAS